MRGRPKIMDEFTDLPISTQRKWQLRQRKRGKCTRCAKPATKGGLCDRHAEQLKGWREARRRKGCLRCGKPRFSANHCLEHAIEIREYYRERGGCKRRFIGAATYQAEIEQMREENP